MAETHTAGSASVLEYAVAEMSCQHCVQAITREVSTVPGVTSVQVDLGAGRVTVHGDTPLDDAAVRAAIDEAGYEVTG